MGPIALWRQPAIQTRCVRRKCLKTSSGQPGSPSGGWIGPAAIAVAGGAAGSLSTFIVGAGRTWTLPERFDRMERKLDTVIAETTQLARFPGAPNYAAIQCAGCLVPRCKHEEDAGNWP